MKIEFGTTRQLVFIDAFVHNADGTFMEHHTFRASDSAGLAALKLKHRHVRVTETPIWTQVASVVRSVGSPPPIPQSMKGRQNGG